MAAQFGLEMPFQEKDEQGFKPTSDLKFFSSPNTCNFFRDIVPVDLILIARTNFRGLRLRPSKEISLIKRHFRVL